MNFKFLVIFFTIVLAGCGVKSDPIPPEGTAIPSYSDKFMQPNENQQKLISEIEEARKTQSLNPTPTPSP